MTIETVLVYAVPMIAVWATYVAARNRLEGRSIAKRSVARESGMAEPASLHPVIDPARCIGCASCVRACPEGDIIGLIDGRAELVEPSHCIGHGACKAACPTNAITLVFGTATRGIDIPNVDENFQTNVPGVFIAGELGGMGLVRNAIEQGRQAIEAIRKREGDRKVDLLDVVIVGCGPAGFSASLAALQYKLRFVTLEQETFGGTVAHFPRGKLVMTAPFTLPLAGKFSFTELSKEELIGLFRKVAGRSGLKVRTGERVEKVMRLDDGFEIRTARGSYRSRNVLLTIGRRGTPRRLDVPGEDQTKVVYRLTDPEQYRGQRVLVAGGGDAALEAACDLSEQPDTVVTISHRSESFSRAKSKNRARLTAAEKSGRVRVLLQSSIKQIGADNVELESGGAPLAIENDAVIVCAGGILPTAFLQDIGIKVETKYGTA